MTNKDIKNALADCADNSCSNCRYYEFPYCYDKLKLDARDRIIRQEQEIKRLREKLTKVLLAVDTVKEMNAMCNIAAQVKQAKIDVLTELKKKTYVNDYCREVVEVEKIDELIAEVQNAED